MQCINCGSSEIAIDEYLQKNFDINICEKCKGTNEDDKFSLITKTKAKKTYLITDEELDRNENLPFIIKQNPKKSHWAKMHLYCRMQVESYAIKKWGSLKEIANQHDLREHSLQTRRKQKFEKDLAALRKGITKVKPSKSNQIIPHQHEFIEVAEGNTKIKLPGKAKSLRMRGRNRGTLGKEVKIMLYAFGDVQTPRQDTADLLEEMVTHYIADMTLKANSVSKRQGKLRTEDLMFVMRKDKKKYSRMQELLYMNEELKKARKAFDADEFETAPTA